MCVTYDLLAIAFAYVLGLIVLPDSNEKLTLYLPCAKLLSQHQSEWRHRFDRMYVHKRYISFAMHMALQK